MNKYYEQTTPFGQGVEEQLMPGENIIWKGKPKKNAFVLNSTMKMAPLALIWLAVDGFMIAAFVGMGLTRMMSGFIIPFFAIHLMPVWIWLYNIVSAGGRWKNTEYAVTDKRVLIRNGFIGYQYQSIYYTDIAHVSMRVQTLDRILGVGDILFSISYVQGGNNTASTNILDVENPEYVFSIVQKTVLDMQTDIYYPNALRPEVNPGYNTQYRP